MLGISTRDRSEMELTLFHSCLPRLEAYHEYVNRRQQSKLTPQRAYDLILGVTEDEDAASRAYNNILFAEMPLV